MKYSLTKDYQNLNLRNIYIYIFATVQRRCMPYLQKHMVEVKFSTTKNISLLFF